MKAQKQPIIREINFFPKADKDPSKYMFKIAGVCGPFCFMTVTETGLNKSIMDATGSTRFFLKEAMLHDYSEQKQGPENKKIIKSHLVTEEGLIDSAASLYRPMTKKGDPRIWFKGMNKYAKAGNLLLLFSIEKEIYVANISNDLLWKTFVNKGHLFNLLSQSRQEELNIRDELLKLIQEIHDKGWIEATTNGDTAVGDTLEHELGLVRNNSTNPDYKGIELKASRTAINGHKKQPTRITLFAKVPDEGLTYRQILEHYGKMQTPKNSNEPRLQLYETFKASHVNAYGLFLKVNDSEERLEIQYSAEKLINSNKNIYVSSWKLENLANSLKEKHKETFFVKAQSKIVNGKEYFLYDKIIHTKNPNTSLLFSLFENDTITLDLLVHINSEGKYRDHGSLFKIKPNNLSMLFGEPEEFNLN